MGNMKVTVLPIVIGVLGTINKRLVQGLDDLEIARQVETIQTYFLSSARIVRLAVSQTPLKIHQVNNNNNNNNNPARNRNLTILRNDAHKILWSFVIQTDYLIPTRR